MTEGRHVIFGGGQVGSPLARALRDSGKDVRIVKRSPGGTPEGIQVVNGDATDPSFCVEASKGASVLYHCMNPPYFAKVWAEMVPRFMDNLIAAASAASARLVVLDNVYMLGRSGGRPMNEDTPVNPCSRKGEIRAQAAERLFAAHERGDLLATTGRASDYYGPGGTQTHVGDQFWPNAVAGKTVRVVTPPDAVHTYHYIPDVAQGLATLGCADDADYGKPWMLPCRPAGTLRDLARQFEGPLGREIKLAQVPRWMVSGLGVFVGIVREVGEMLYQWEEPFIIDDSRFRGRFAAQPTGAEPAAEATVRWAKSHYA